MFTAGDMVAAVGDGRRWRRRGRQAANPVLGRLLGDKWCCGGRTPAFLLAAGVVLVRRDGAEAGVRHWKQALPAWRQLLGWASTATALKFFTARHRQCEPHTIRLAERW